MKAEVTYTPRIPVAADYVAAIGRAAYNFAYLEWAVIWLGETIDRGHLHKATTLTAGQMFQAFGHLVKQVPPGDKHYAAMNALAATLPDLAVRRNALLHGKSYTAQGGEQRLHYSGKSGHQDWEIADILEAARSFELAAIEANRIFHDGRYAAYQAANPPVI